MYVMQLENKLNISMFQKDRLANDKIGSEIFDTDPQMFYGVEHTVGHSFTCTVLATDGAVPTAGSGN